MGEVATCLATLAGLLVAARAQPFTGCCSFDEPFSSCGYTQSVDDDLNWNQVHTLVKPSSDPWMPSDNQFYGYLIW
ncbi:hypothetical protein Y1Q_0007881 [Alligator mississippiensis]|uniref:MAM domain-containing protein n=1 Tax=Alligator mississippiensis TaxID=8496 RepID=A0A151NEQ1_ALLMI|nr:hypothetical protein Y1Q_0007881 [Alligator mississippiensis]